MFDQKEICEGGYIKQAIGHLYPLKENMIFVGVTPRGYPGHARGHAPTKYINWKKKLAIGHLYPLWVFEPTQETKNPSNEGLC